MLKNQNNRFTGQNKNQAESGKQVQMGQGRQAGRSKSVQMSKLQEQVQVTKGIGTDRIGNRQDQGQVG